MFPGHPQTQPTLFEHFDFFGPRIASTISTSTSRSDPVRQFLKKMHRKIHKNGTKTMQIIPKLHQNTWNMFSGHPRTERKDTKFSIFSLQNHSLGLQPHPWRPGDPPLMENCNRDLKYFWRARPCGNCPEFCVDSIAHTLNFCKQLYHAWRLFFERPPDFRLFWKTIPG